MQSELELRSALYPQQLCISPQSHNCDVSLGGVSFASLKAGPPQGQTPPPPHITGCINLRNQHQDLVHKRNPSQVPYSCPIRALT